MSGSMEPVLAAIAALSVDIGGRIEGLGSRVDGLAGELTCLRVEVMDRLDRQQNLLTAMKDDMQVNIAAADTTREELKVFRNQQHDLTHQVSLIHRRLLRLESRFDAKENGA